MNQNKSSSSKAIFILLLGTLIWNLPTPEGLEPKGQQIFAIFLSTILSVIFQIMPMGALSLISICFTIFLKVLTPKEAFSAFGNEICWKIVLAFFIARGFIKTQLGRRIAFYFLRMFGRSSLGLSYGVLSTEFLLAPAIPSATARSGAVIFPIVRSLSESFNSHADDKASANRIGSFLSLICIHGSTICSALFLTAMASNSLIVAFMQEQGLAFSWMGWAQAAIGPGIISLLFTPYIIYKLAPPTIKDTHEIRSWAKEKLKEMGPLTKEQAWMLFFFLLLIFLWAGGSVLNISSTAAALVGIAGLLVTNVLSWDDIKTESGAWDTLVWFSTLLLLGTKLNELGFVFWLSQLLTQFTIFENWAINYMIIGAIYFYVHYFFASSTAHIASLYTIFLSLAISVGIPPYTAALFLAFSSSLAGGLTHYGFAPAPIIFGSGYVEINTWWKVGFVVGSFHFLTWIILGPLWWNFLGL